VGSHEKIRVCHLISGDLWAGAEMAMFTMVNALKDHPQLAISAIVLNNGKLALKLKEIEIPTTVIAEGNNNFIRIIGKVRKALGNGQIDIIHAHRYKENIIGALVKRSCGIKTLVTTVHGTREHFKGLKSAKAAAYSMLNNHYVKAHFNRVIAVSDEIRNDLIKSFGREKVVTVHNAIDVSKIKPSKQLQDMKKEFGMEPSTPAIGVVGRMVPIKGLEVFLGAAKLILEKRKDVRFLMVGDGPEKASLEGKAVELGINDNVIFTGFRGDVIDIINCLDILVLSSYHEGIPMVLLEGIALCKPVVATAVGGIPEVIENEVSGLLVESGNAAALADGCLRILDSDELESRLARAGYERLQTEYSTVNQRNSLFNIYHGLSSKT
jgi:glycosyltransferase involved in cell wall biosynthesis